MTRDIRTADLAALLEHEGIAPARARALAETVIEQQVGSRPGTVYGGLDSLGVARIWERATFAGVRRLVLEVEAEAARPSEDEGRITVRVLDAEQWADWSDEDARQAAGVAGLLADWSEVDVLARDDDSPDLWTAPVDPAGVLEVPSSWAEAVDELRREGLQQEAQSRARAEDMN